jgi:hypothetical protein
MSSSLRPFPRVVLLPSVLLVLALLGGAALGACSSSGSSPAAAAAASDAVGRSFTLPEDAMACLKEHFAADGKAAAAMTSTGELSSSQRTAVAKVLEACVTVDQWAEAVAGRITAALPPADSSKLTTQISCLTGAVGGLDEAQRQARLVGLVVIATAPQTGGLAVERGDVINTLYAACSVKPSR